MTTKPLRCPCGAADYAACCGRYHNGIPAPDAETPIEPLAIRVGRQQTPANSLVMMRSRYSAYVLKLEAYLLATWHPSTRPAALDLATDNTKWLGLEVRKHQCRISGSSHRGIRCALQDRRPRRAPARGQPLRSRGWAVVLSWTGNSSSRFLSPRLNTNWPASAAPASPAPGTGARRSAAVPRCRPRRHRSDAGRDNP